MSGNSSPREPARKKGPPPLPKPSAKELAELGLIVEGDGLCAVKMLVGASGEGFSLEKDEVHRCKPALAASWVRRHIAWPKLANK